MGNEASEEKQYLLNEHYLDPDLDLENMPSEEVSAEPRKWLSQNRGMLIGIGVGIVITLVGSRILGSFPQETPAVTETTTESALEASSPSQTVTVANVEVSQVSNTISATGTVAAFELVPVKARESGLQIQEILVREGDIVRAGQVLARLDESGLQAQMQQARASVAQAEARLAEVRAGSRLEEIAQAEARLAQAQARLGEARASIPRRIQQAESQVASASARLNLAQDRYRSSQTLLNQGAISRDRFNEAQSEYRSAQASFAEAQQRLEEARGTDNPNIAQLEASIREAQAQLTQMSSGNRPEVITQAEAQLAQSNAQLQSVTNQLQNTRVVAPVGGQIATRNARVGDVATSGGEAMFSIIENGRLELLLRVPENQLAEIRTGQSVRVTSNTDQNLQITGTIREIDPVINEESRQGIVRVDLPSARDLQPGMFLRGAIITSSASGLTVPAKAVLPQSDGSANVFVLQPDNTVRMQPVEMGELVSGEQVEILQGLTAGDRVVVKGAAYLQDGEQVAISDDIL